jgi:SPP1 family predicted phage head-tail adaptor
VRMLDEIKLRAVSRSVGAGGYTTETVSETTVYADVMSVKRSEFYAAGAAGMKADVVFVINADEYAGQAEVEYDGKIYDVIRTFQMAESRTSTRVYRGDLTRVELTCARR